MIKICEICGKEYEGRSFSKYCSANCKRIRDNKVANDKKSKKRKLSWEQMEHTKECEICGCTFELTQKHRSQKYCSSKCRRKAERVFGSKKDVDSKYKDEIRFGGNRKKVLLRDDYTCTMCGNKRNLVVHHIDFSGQGDNPNNDLDNLVTLCRKCHINIHKILNK